MFSTIQTCKRLKRFFNKTLYFFAKPEARRTSKKQQIKSIISHGKLLSSVSMSLEKREMMRPEGVVSVKAKGAKNTACSIKLCIPSLATSIPRRSKMSKSNCTTPDRTEAHSQRHCGCAKQRSIAVPTSNFYTLNQNQSRIRQKQNYSFFIWLTARK